MTTSSCSFGRFLTPNTPSDSSGSFSAEYCPDLVETATGKPVNSPFEYELWGVPNTDADTPWLSIPMCGKLRSTEQSHGMKQADVLPGEEKLVLRGGQTVSWRVPSQSQATRCQHHIIR